MGTVSSRTILCEWYQPRESKVHPERNVSAFIAPDRLVCDELCKKVQRSFPNKKSETRNRVSVVQVPPKSLQQEDV